MIKLNEFMELEKKLHNKYNCDDCEKWTEEEYQNYQKMKDEFLNATGLTEKEFISLKLARKYKISKAVSNLVLEIIDDMDKRGITLRDEILEFYNLSLLYGVMRNE